MFSKKEGSTVCIKMVVDRIEIDPRSMCQLLFEAENYKEWFPFTRESRVIASCTPTSKIVFAKMWLPPPLSNRYLNMWACGVNRLFTPKKSVLVVLQSIDKEGEQYFLDTPLCHPKNVRMAAHIFGFEVTILSRTEISIKAVV